MIDGVVEPDDYDVFRFHAEAGQTLIFDVMATRAGSRLDSTLTILDERGAELDFIDDYYIHKDPYLSFAVRKTGDYFVRVAAATEPMQLCSTAGATAVTGWWRAPCRTC